MIWEFAILLTIIITGAVVIPTIVSIVRTRRKKTENKERHQLIEHFKNACLGQEWSNENLTREFFSKLMLYRVPASEVITILYNSPSYRHELIGRVKAEFDPDKPLLTIQPSTASYL